MKLDDATKNFSHVGIGRASAIIFQTVFYLLFASILGPESYGELNVIIALAGTFAIVSRFGLNLSLQVYQAKKRSETTDQIKTLFVISTSVAALILLLIDVFAAVLCLGFSFFIMNQQNLLGLLQYKKFMINTILRNILFLIIPIILYFVLEIPGIVLGMAIASIIGSIPLFSQLKLRSFSGLRNIYKVLIQNYILDLSLLSYMLDKLIISYLFGLFIVGISQFNLQVLLALGVLPSVLGSYLISEESRGVTHNKISYLVILGSIVLSIVVIIMSPFFVNEFFPKYSDGIFSLQIIVLSIVPKTISTLFGAKLLARESTKVGYVSLIYLASFIVLISILGEFYGLEGLSIAVMFSSIISAIFNYIIYRKQK